VPTLMVNYVNVRTVWLDESVTLVNLDTGTFVYTIHTDVKVKVLFAINIDLF